MEEQKRLILTQPMPHGSFKETHGAGNITRDGCGAKCGTWQRGMGETKEEGHLWPKCGPSPGETKKNNVIAIGEKSIQLLDGFRPLHLRRGEQRPRPPVDP